MIGLPRWRLRSWSPPTAPTPTLLGLPLYPDLVPGRGALGGLYTALSAASQPLVAVVACDMPFASPACWRRRDLLVETGADSPSRTPPVGWNLSMPSTAGKPACRRSWPPSRPIAGRVDASFSRVQMQFMDEDSVRLYDPELLCFSNVNTPEELEAAVQKAAREGN